jgi:hypothetical protein
MLMPKPSGREPRLDRIPPLARPANSWDRQPGWNLEPWCDTLCDACPRSDGGKFFVSDRVHFRIPHALMYRHGDRCKPARRLGVFLYLPAAQEAAHNVSLPRQSAPHIPRPEITIVGGQRLLPCQLDKAELFAATQTGLRRLRHAAKKMKIPAAARALVIALAIIGAIALRVGGWGKPGDAKDLDTARVGMPPVPEQPPTERVAASRFNCKRLCPMN